MGPKFYSVSSFLPRDAKLFVSWSLLRIGASFLTVLLGNALDAFCHRVTHRSSGIHLLHMPQRDTLLFGCKAKLRTADIRLNVFFPLAEVRTELGKRKTFRAFWTIVAYRVASGAADAGEDGAGNPINEFVGFRLVASKSEFINGSFVDYFQSLKTTTTSSRRRGGEIYHPFPIFRDVIKCMA